MTRTLVIALAAVAATTVIAARQQAPPAGQIVFRAGADLVTVDVSVRSSGTPVAGLTAKDFVLLDNGVPQRIDLVELEPVPVDITILVDTSLYSADYLESIGDDARKIAAMARPFDRLRLMAIGDYVTDLVAVQPAATFQAPSSFTAGGLPSAHDGLAAALLRPVESDRRHLVVALMNGVDALSTLDAQAVKDIARRSNATLHIAQVDTALEMETWPRPPRWVTNRERLEGFACGPAGRCQPQRRFWRPHNDEEFDALAEAAASTGGAMHHEGVFVDRSAQAIFKKVFEDFRRSYLLRYTPQGVKRDGWHEITVTLVGHPSYTVHARRGYSIEIERAGPPKLPAPSTPSALSGATTAPATLDEIVAAYRRADYGSALTGVSRSSDLARLLRDIREGDNPWPDRPEREAAFVLELAAVGLNSPQAAARTQASQLLLEYHRLIRQPLGPDPFERFWLWAALAILEGANQPVLAQRFVDHALMRFPNEPRFVLARAFLTDQLLPIGMADGRAGAARASAGHVRDVLARYDAAIALEETAGEARVRKAWFLRRVGRPAEALGLLDEATDDGLDAAMRYLRQLFRGRVLDALDRPSDAIAAYRAAHLLVPDAQSPRVALMNLHLRQGDRASAEVFAEAIQAAPPSSFDPWWQYWIGDYRRYPEAILRLRDQTR